MVHVRRIGLTVAAITLFVLIVAPTLAFAAGPSLSPTTIVFTGFDSASDSPYTLAPVSLLGVAPAASWGTVIESKRSGTAGLWCAGSGGWSTAYPAGTRGIVSWDTPTLTNFYSSKLSFWYVERSFGSADANAFWVRWSDPSDFFHVSVFDGFPATSSWVQRQIDISSGTASLSRRAGKVEIEFYNTSAGDPNNPGTGSSTGQGPAIDDLSVTGWKYGPVRNVTVNKVGTVAHLTWGRPLRSTAANATTEERTIAYRVYREPDGSNAWTELTVDGNNTAEHFDDTSIAALSGTYRYVVQAVDAVGGCGQVLLPADSALQAFTQLPGAPVFTLTGIPSGPTPQNVTPGYSTTETASSVAATLDGAQFNFGSTVSTEGTHTLVVRMSNAGGATEHFVIFAIDKHAPSTTDNHPTGTVLTPVTVVLNAVDSVSGVRATYYSLDGGSRTVYAGGIAINSFKTHSLSYYSVDNAGNSEAQHTVSIVMRRPTTLSIASSTKTPTHGHSFTLSGYLSPGSANEHIVVKYQRPGSSKWYSVTRHTTASGSNGRWSWRYTPLAKGTYHFKAWYSTTTTKYQSGSSTLTLKAK